MKINSSILTLLFLFLFAIVIASCESSDIEDEVALDEKQLNEILEKNNAETYLVDKDSDRPGNQGGSGN
ncbi:hypothetical protein [Aquimarina latercula]|uniref:hypothetical protein n=1 Tax=Aquimarina latercula TaxID=987 RepID=UPI00040798FA|nr:hypothetical protein [Aquimarina latercula]